MNDTRPVPLGIYPRFLLAEDRLREIDAALARYEAAGWPPLMAWLEERDDLLAYLRTYRAESS